MHIAENLINQGHNNNSDSLQTHCILFKIIICNMFKY